MREDAAPFPTRGTVVPRFSRRGFLAATGAVLGVGSGLKLLRDRDEAACRAAVFIARAASYEDDLPRIIRRGLTELGLGRAWARGKSVLLKPNLVEPTCEAPHVNTHPAVVRAVAEVFRGWGARAVFVAEGQGHCRDADLVLEQSGLGPVLDEDRIAFVDLNCDDVFATRNRLGFTGLRQLFLPVTLRRADLIVSLPKLKTHHWAGVTCAMKNLFGVMPGLCYGWPKNVLHREGIPQSILDINGVVGRAPGDRRRNCRHGGRRADHGDPAVRRRPGHGRELAGRRCHGGPAHAD